LHGDLKLVDSATSVLDGRRSRGLADPDPGARRVQHAHGFVGQLPPGDVTLGEPHGVEDRLVQDPHMVVQLQRGDQPAYHFDAAGFVRLLDLDDLKSPSQRGIFFEVLLVFGPGRGGDRPQFAAGQGRLEQIGRIASAGLTAGADHRMGLVDEQDDRRGR
jgi:hypothetical protein